MNIEHCLCGAPVDVTEQSLRSFRDPRVIRGCKACKYTGTKPAPVGAVVVNTANDNGGK